MTWPAEEDRAYAAEVGRRLRRWRVVRRLTQQQTADRAGVDRVVVIAAERGAVALDLSRLRRLAWAVGAPLSELVDEDRVPPRAARSYSGTPGLLPIGADLLGWPGRVKGGACAVAPAMP